MKKARRFPWTHLIILVLAVYVGPAKATTITSITQNGSTIGRYEKFEVTFTLSQTYTNPFDPCIVDIMVTFIKPDGNTVMAPAFYYKEYDEDASGNFVNGRNPCWKARISPAQLGVYDINQIKIIDSGGTTTTDPNISFTCVESGKKGLIRVDSRDPCYMRFDNNETYVPIGHNVGWLNLNGTSQWKSFFAKMGNAGENWVRIWMCHFYQGVSLEWSSDHWTGYYSGVGNLSMPLAWRLDRMVEGCEQNDVAIQLALQHHGQFSTTTDENWDDNPYNITHAATDGGFLSDPCKFFTDANAIRLTKNKYRYIVARWGYSPAILAWELFNEVQFVDAWKLSSDKSSVVNWHNTMASYIHSIDPFNHPVTTSSHGSGFGNIWNLADINLVQVHYYGTDTIKTFEQTALSLASYKKPVFIGEFGIGGSAESNPSSLPEPKRSQVYEGLELHNGIWSACLMKSSGNLWWWDNYIDPCNLYGVFTPLAVYAANENLADYNLARAQRAASGTEAYFATPVLTDWGAVSTQKVFYLDGDYFPGMDNLSKWLMGSWQTALKSDPNFHLTMPTAGALRIHVSQVSNSGTNSLQVLVNGVVVFSQTFTNGSTNFIVTVSLSAGQQAVQIKNTGQDWFYVNSYEFAPNNVSPLDSIGLSSNKRAYIWIYDVNSQYGLTNNGTFHNEPVIAKGLDDGSYTVEVYATRGAGGIVASGTADSNSGQLTYTLPDFSKDIAVKVSPCYVDWDDLKAFCEMWLLPGIDLDGDGGNADFTDFNIFAGYWLGQCPADWPL
jgi:hypothetical protein